MAKGDFRIQHSAGAIKADCVDLVDEQSGSSSKRDAGEFAGLLTLCTRIWKMGNGSTRVHSEASIERTARMVFDGINRPNLFSWNIMLQAYAHNGHLDEARSLLERMPERDSVSWTAMIQAYVENGQLEQAKEMFNRMPQRDVSLVEGHGCSICPEGVSGNSKDERDVASWDTMVIAYAHNGDFEEAKEAFDRMPQRDIVSWTAMITACAQKGHLQEAKQDARTTCCLVECHDCSVCSTGLADL